MLATSGGIFGGEAKPGLLVRDQRRPTPRQARRRQQRRTNFWAFTLSPCTYHSLCWFILSTSSCRVYKKVILAFAHCFRILIIIAYRIAHSITVAATLVWCGPQTVHTKHTVTQVLFLALIYHSNKSLRSCSSPSSHLISLLPGTQRFPRR